MFHWHKALAPRSPATIVDAGYLVSVTPEVVYRERDRELVESVPLDSLLVESDAPWPYQGEFENVTSGPVAGRRGWRKRWRRSSGCPSTRRCTASPSTPAALFDLVWA